MVCRICDGINWFFTCDACSKFTYRFWCHLLLVAFGCHLLKIQMLLMNSVLFFLGTNIPMCVLSPHTSWPTNEVSGKIIFFWALLYVTPPLSNWKSKHIKGKGMNVIYLVLVWFEFLFVFGILICWIPISSLMVHVKRLQEWTKSWTKQALNVSLCNKMSVLVHLLN